MTQYVSVKLPKVLGQEIDGILKPHGYSSRAEFVKDAVRSHLVKVKEANPS